MKYYFFTIKNGAIASNNLTPASKAEMYEAFILDGKDNIYYIIAEGCITNIMCEADSLANARKSVELFLSIPIMGNTKYEKRAHKNAVH